MVVDTQPPPMLLRERIPLLWFLAGIKHDMVSDGRLYCSRMLNPLMEPIDG